MDTYLVIDLYVPGPYFSLATFFHVLKCCRFMGWERLVCDLRFPILHEIREVVGLGNFVELSGRGRLGM